MGPVVDPGWVRSNRDRVVLADVRYYLDGRAGRDAYLAGHLPGAVFVDVDHDLAAHGRPPAEGRHPLPDPEHFAARMAAAGINDHDTVIAYDDAGGVMAARLVWMLRATGHEAALLDGGIDAYDGDRESGPPHRPRGTFTARPWPSDRLADIDAAARSHPAPDAPAGDAPAQSTPAQSTPAHAAPAHDSVVVIDARPGERFRGDSEPLDPRAGHIPGARNLPCRENLTADGRLLPVPELRTRFAAVGVVPGVPVISYCGSGVTACHNLLAMEHAGLGVGRLYPGSWSAYSQTGRPAGTGDQSGRPVR